MELSRQWPGHCPVFHRDLLSVVARVRSDKKSLPEISMHPASVHGIVAAIARALPGFSPRLAFGCRFGAAGLKSIDRNFNAPCFRLSLRRGRDKKSLPGFSPRPCFGCLFGAARQKIIARFFTAPCFRLSPKCGQRKNHCPKFQRGLSSVHRFVAAVARALPGLLPRLAFGCRSDAVRQKIIARNFNAALFWCIDLSRQSPGRCPVYYRDLLSVVAQALPHKNSLSEISSRSRRK